MENNRNRDVNTDSNYQPSSTTNITEFQENEGESSQLNSANGANQHFLNTLKQKETTGTDSNKTHSEECTCNKRMDEFMKNRHIPECKLHNTLDISKKQTNDNSKLAFNFSLEQKVDSTEEVRDTITDINKHNNNAFMSVMQGPVFRKLSDNILTTSSDRAHDKDEKSSSLNGECSGSTISKQSFFSKTSPQRDELSCLNRDFEQPLSVCTSQLPTPISKSNVSPYIHCDPSFPTSPIIVKFPDEMDEQDAVKKKEMLLKLLQSTEMSEERKKLETRERCKAEGSMYSSPFPLQDPPKSKIKRHLSVESIESQSSERKPAKRQQIGENSRSAYIHEVIKKSPHDSLQRPIDNQLLKPNLEKSFSQIKHVSNKDEQSYINDHNIHLHTFQSPSSKESFYQTRQFKTGPTFKDQSENDDVFISDTDYPNKRFGSFPDLHRKRLEYSETQPRVSTPKEYISTPQSEAAQDNFINNQLFYSYSPMKANDLKTSDDSNAFENELSGFDCRDRHLYSIPTASISINSMNHVTDKGFVFPEKSTLKEPILFSPRVVNSGPRFPSGRHQNTHLSQETDMQNIHQEFRVPIAPPTFDETYNKQRLTRRSNSDIDHSPSKLEIELQRRYDETIFRRTISDPTARRPHEKNVIYENRMNNNFQSIYDKSREHLMFYDAEFAKNKCLLESKISRRIDEQNEPFDRSFLAEKARRSLLEDFSSERQFIANQQLQSHRKSSKQKQIIDSKLAKKLLGSNRFSIDDILSFNSRPISSSDSSEDDDQNDEIMKKALIKASMESLKKMAKSSEDIERNDSPSPNKKRKYKGEEIDVRVTCTELSEKTKTLQESLRDAEHDQSECTCTQIENQILFMARNAYKQLCNKDPSGKTFQQFEMELQETNSKLFDAMKLFSSMKAMCKHNRKIIKISTGSVVFTLLCPTVKSMDTLWKLHRSRELEKQVNEDFVTDDLKRKFKNTQVYLKVDISVVDFRDKRSRLARIELRRRQDLSLSHSDSDLSVISNDQESFNRSFISHKCPSKSILHTGCHSAPSSQITSPIGWRQRSPMSPVSPNCLSPSSPYDVSRRFLFPPYERQAFRKISSNEEPPKSPTLKKLKDLDLNMSPKTSPKRKTFAEPFPWEDENVCVEMQSQKRKPLGDQK